MGILALVALLRKNAMLLICVIAGWMAQFTFFAAMDVWAADRGELQEHTVYFVVFTQLLATVLVIALAARVRQWLQRSTSLTSLSAPGAVQTEPGVRSPAAGGPSV
ncbi:hypothetical protein [Streptomyces sp. TBY4]|uniref:hypothetical protein n=1 Tax=Streptomyces sp. TBY4 TaxID=2962030 RepID=UPI0020B68859|nr:hypothetical protein [Streptomyces sp. TBY4]MCP3757043.1 hypothetical protein [Streptomyces sp. TBY4]